MRNLTADGLHKHFWDTVFHLKEYSELTVVASISDGASTNRLMQKMNVSDLSRGTPNHFVRAWCRNRLEPRKKIFFLSDPSHLIKKAMNNWESSCEGGTKDMWMPEPLVDAILSQVEQRVFDPRDTTRSAGQQVQSAPRGSSEEPSEEPEPDSIGALAARTRGEEAFIYLFGRMYEHMVDSMPYSATAKTLEQLRADKRLVELNFLLHILRTWHEYNAKVDVEGEGGLCT